LIVDRSSFPDPSSLVTHHSSLVPELHAFLKDRLPAYMMPAAFVLLRALPLAPNGKVDLKALPAPGHERPELEMAYTAPRSALERTIAAVWQTALHVEKVGIDDNFFDLGGHSLLLVQVHSQLRETFNHLSLIDMFKYPTISSLAAYLHPEHAEEASAEDFQERANKQREFRDRRKQLMTRGE
jgi:aryl carrier-like protein